MEVEIWDGMAYRILREPLPKSREEAHQRIIDVLNNPEKMRDIFERMKEIQ